MGGLGGPRFRLLTGRRVPGLEARLETGRGALAVLDAHLAARDWLVGDAPTIADLGAVPLRRASRRDAGLDAAAAARRRVARPACARCRASSTTSSLYPDNAPPGAGARSRLRSA